MQQLAEEYQVALADMASLRAGDWAGRNCCAKLCFICQLTAVRLCKGPESPRAFHLRIQQILGRSSVDML